MTNWNPDHVMLEIEQMLGNTQTPNKTKWCIYRVPHDIRKVNKDAYTPEVISIGPFHYDNERLQNMQTHKWAYLERFMHRSNTNLRELVSFIGSLEPSIRHCYAENIKFDKDNFIIIVLLDACFIIELFLRTHKKDWPEEDALSPDTRISDIIQYDLLLLENQLPFFVLEKIFNLAFPSRESNNLPSILQLTFENFTFLNKQGLSPTGVNIYHFTDLLRHFNLQHPSSERPKRVHTEEVLHFNATELHKAGLRFKEFKNSSCLLGLQLSGRVLQIPQISVEDHTEVLLRNMMAFEQCRCPNESYITDLVAIFDFLINTSNDVDILIHNGIIQSLLDDSDAVAKLFNGLRKNIIHENFNSDYVDLIRKLNKFCRNPRQKLMATLRRDYCNTPWQSAASTAGILLLLMTLIQAVCSVIQVMQQSKKD